MKVLVTGANGQLGTELCKLLDEQHISYSAFDKREMDITNQNAVDEIIFENKPTVIFHCAAYTAVDKAEDEGKVLNEQINVEGTKNVAIAAENIGATLVYISTDYVFDGTKKTPYQVDDAKNPESEYGRTKYLGELEVEENCSKYYIIRTSWVFGNYGANFVFTMKKLAETRTELMVVNDQFGRPTWTRTLAEFMVFVIEKNADYGVYHLSNDESCTWFEFAKEILKDTEVTILPVDSDGFPQKAKRPKHSIMDLSKTKALGFTIPTWKEALKKMLD